MNFEFRISSSIALKSHKVFFTGGGGAKIGGGSRTIEQAKRGLTDKNYRLKGGGP